MAGGGEQHGGAGPHMHGARSRGGSAVSCPLGHRLRPSTHQWHQIPGPAAKQPAALLARLPCLGHTGPPQAVVLRCTAALGAPRWHACAARVAQPVCACVNWTLKQCNARKSRPTAVPRLSNGFVALSKHVNVNVMCNFVVCVMTSHSPGRSG